MYPTLGSLGVSAMLFSRGLNVYEGFMLCYDSNSHAYHVFNKGSGCVETTRDAVLIKLTSLKWNNMILMM
jgi:hypothetical protein